MIIHRITDCSCLMFFVKSLKQFSDHFNILNYVAFSNSRTRSATPYKLHHNYSPSNKIRNSYFNHLPRLWNALPPIDIELHFTIIKSTIYKYLWSHFTEHFIQVTLAHIIFFARVIIAVILLPTLFLGN